MTGSQLGPLLVLRWWMVRSRRARWGFAALAATVPAMFATAVAAGVLLPDERRFDVTVLAPTAYLSVAVLAVLAPLLAGGGNELFPDEQLVAYPLTSRTRYAASLALIPLNLAWTAQVVGLLGVTAYIAPGGLPLLFAVATCLAYVAFVTVGGQALAWVVVGIRQRREGRLVTSAVGGAIVVATFGVVVTGRTADVLDKSPTTYVVIGALNGSSGGWLWWAATTGSLALLAGLSYVGGRRACTWALRQPGDAALRIVARVVRRRVRGRTPRACLLATDRASVWRSAALRRGLLVLAILPGGIAALSGLEWASLVLLPGLVAAGAGLLFGVNVFCLDGSGSMWLASLPGRPAVAFWCKTQVVAEVCLVAITITVVAGGVRAGRLPTAAEVAALLAGAVTVLLGVVATCMSLSTTRPHRAELRGPRDTPAPPGVMAAYSARLALSTTLIGVLFSGLAEVASWEWPVLFAVPFVLLSLRRLVQSSQRWQDATSRSRVVTVVAAG